jgi:hypothetical protein
MLLIAHIECELYGCKEKWGFKKISHKIREQGKSIIFISKAHQALLLQLFRQSLAMYFKRYYSRFRNKV